MQGSSTNALVSLVLVFILAGVSNIDASVTKAVIDDRSGGWVPVKNVADPKIVEIARFAVSEYDRVFSRSFELVKVVKGEIQQVQNDAKYHLYIVVQAEGNTYDYGTFVQVINSSKSLISFFPGSGN